MSFAEVYSYNEMIIVSYFCGKIREVDEVGEIDVIKQ